MNKLKESKITLETGVSIQIMPNTPFTVVTANGFNYVKFMPAGGEASVADNDDMGKALAAGPAKHAAPAACTLPTAAPSAAIGKKHTEAELMEIGNNNIKDLEKILIKYGVDKDAYEGKNTNKKLRELILLFEDGTITATPQGDETEAPAAPTAPAKGRGAAKSAAVVNDDILAILQKVDAGEIDVKKALKAVIAAYPEADDAQVSELLTEFFDDPALVIDDVAANISKVVNETEAPAAPVTARGRGAVAPAAPAPAARGKKVAEPEVVTEDDLQVGNVIKAYWEDPGQFFEGTVKKISKLGTLVVWEDDDESIIDGNITEIQLVSAE